MFYIYIYKCWSKRRRSDGGVFNNRSLTGGLSNDSSGIPANAVIVGDDISIDNSVREALQQTQFVPTASLQLQTL
jgi:hypothetical protein